MATILETTGVYSSSQKLPPDLNLVRRNIYMDYLYLRQQCVIHMETITLICSVTNVMAKIKWKVRTLNLTLALTLTLTLTIILSLNLKKEKERKVESDSSVLPSYFQCWPELKLK